jgi:hypothetical protein
MIMRGLKLLQGVLIQALGACSLVSGSLQLFGPLAHQTTRERSKEKLRVLEKVGRERQVKCQVCLPFDVGIFLNG